MHDSLSKIDMENLPRHIGIIMDGNGRWAKKNAVSRIKGHEAGAVSVRKVVKACRELGIEALSLYAFSTENWRRSKTEVNALFRLLGRYIRLELDNIDAQDIRVTVMGRMAGLPKRTQKDLSECIERTAENASMVLNLAINYGGRAEIADAAQQIAREVATGELDPEAIDEAMIAQHLYVPELPELDLLIRTSGETRVSNFMLWQISYAEFVVQDTFWPDFRKEHLCNAIVDLQSRSRRFGGRK